MSEETKLASGIPYEELNWQFVKFNQIDKAQYDKLQARYDKLYCTFLGKTDEFTLFMFKPLKWSEFKDIRAKKLDKDLTHDYVLNSCIVHPKVDPIALAGLDAGMALTLVYQILIMSNFFKDPATSLQYVLEVK